MTVCQTEEPIANRAFFHSHQKLHVLQIVSVMTTTLPGRRLAILAAGMDSHISGGPLQKYFKPGHYFVVRWFANFPCNYDLRMFPFDQQNCELEFKMRNAIKAQVISSARKIVILEYTIFHFPGPY